jgi:hypothetical protein
MIGRDPAGGGDRTAAVATRTHRRSTRRRRPAVRGSGSDSEGQNIFQRHVILRPDPRAGGSTAPPPRVCFAATPRLRTRAIPRRPPQAGRHRGHVADLLHSAKAFRRRYRHCRFGVPPLLVEAEETAVRTPLIPSVHIGRVYALKSAGGLADVGCHSVLACCSGMPGRRHRPLHAHTVMSRSIGPCRREQRSFQRPAPWLDLPGGRRHVPRPVMSKTCFQHDATLDAVAATPDAKRAAGAKLIGTGLASAGFVG